MGFNLEAFKGKMRGEGPVVGVNVTMTDYGVSELMGFLGFDYIWLDAEHFPLEGYDVRMHAIAANSARIPLFVRVRSSDPMLVKPLLDAGVDGVIFPAIRTVEEARAAIASCIYPPQGSRGFGPSRCTGYGMAQEPADYVKTASDQVYKIIQVEHVDCVDCLEEIASIPGLDALMLGPNDLSGSVGLLGQHFHPAVQKLMARTAAVAAAHRLPLGIAAGDDAGALVRWVSYGIRWFCIGGDLWYMKEAALRSLNAYREAYRALKAGGERGQ